MCKINCRGGCPECDPDGHKPKPHKHAATIKAWADGASVQVLNHGQWIPVTSSPAWFEDYQYRLKPEEKPLGLVAKEAWFAANKTVCLTHSEVWQTCADAVVKAYKERTGS